MRSSIRLPCVYYFFLAVVIIRYETAATARWALMLIVRAFFNDTITVAIWTGFHVRLMGMLPHPSAPHAASHRVRSPHQSSWWDKYYTAPVNSARGLPERSNDKACQSRARSGDW